MDLDTTQKVIQIILGIITLCGTLYGCYRLFHKRVSMFVRSRTRVERQKQGKQCPRCQSFQAKQASRCRSCKFQFSPHGQRRGRGR